MNHNQLELAVRMGILYADVALSLMECTKVIVHSHKEKVQFEDLRLEKSWSSKPVIVHGNVIIFESRLQMNRVDLLGDDINGIDIYPMSTYCKMHSFRNNDVSTEMFPLHDEEQYNKAIQHYSDVELFTVGVWNRFNNSYLIQTGEGVVLNIRQMKEVFNLPSIAGFSLPHPFRKEQ